MTTISLPKTPDADTFELLTRAVAFLAHARSHATLGAPVDGMVAVHGLDNAVEYLLRILVRHLDMESVSGKSYDIVDLAGLYGEVNAFLKEHCSTSLPYQSDIRLLRQVRNLVQHGVVDPRADLLRFETMVTRLYDRIFQRMFGLDPKAMRVSSLIRNETVSEHLRISEEHIEAKRYLESVVSSRDAFENALYEQTQSSQVRISGAPAILDAQEYNQMKYFFRAVIDELELRSLGVNAAQYQRYDDYTKHIPVAYKSGSSYAHVMPRSWEKADAEFCYRFVGDMVLTWQNQSLALIQTPTNDGIHEHKEWFGEAHIPTNTNHMIYLEEADVYAELLHVNTETKKAIIDLCIDDVYEHRWQYINNGILTRDVTEKVYIRGHDARRLVNNPPIWEVILRYQIIPGTQRGQSLKEGNLVDEIDEDERH